MNNTRHDTRHDTRKKYMEAAEEGLKNMEELLKSRKTNKTRLEVDQLLKSLRARMNKVKKTEGK